MQTGIAVFLRITGKNRQEHWGKLQNQAKLSSSWKQEVNERVAAHRNRKPAPALEQETHTLTHHNASKRAAAAAARVAARFANAPTYNEQLAEEARAAVRAAGVASRAALEAQAAAESMLAGLEAARDAAAERQFDGDAENDESASAVAANVLREFKSVSEEREEFEERWEAEQPRQQVELPHTGAVQDEWSEMEDWRKSSRLAMEAAEKAARGDLDPQAHANLIEFPRQIVAPRKARPRRAEGPLAETAGAEPQLSIFEVDPSAISTEPAPAAAAPAWSAPQWSGIKLDAQPQNAYTDEQARPWQEEPQAGAYLAQAEEQAPVSLVVLAAVVDIALMLAALVFAANVAMRHMAVLPSAPRVLEIISAAGFLVTGAAYLALFYALAAATPGMAFARISLRTFDGDEPTREQRFRRFLSLLVSVLPMGLGVVWAIFDDDHLCWHDRLSQTYLRVRTRTIDPR
jgi:uncharacterized RDD family membrane protein YckC